MIAYFWRTMIAAVSIVRYMLPALVLVIALAAVGVDNVLRSLPQVPTPRPSSDSAGAVSEIGIPDGK